jgi:hypothetical protein
MSDDPFGKIFRGKGAGEASAPEAPVEKSEPDLLREIASNTYWISVRVRTIHHIIVAWLTSRSLAGSCWAP